MCAMQRDADENVADLMLSSAASTGQRLPSMSSMVTPVLRKVSWITCGCDPRFEGDVFQKPKAWTLRDVTCSPKSPKKRHPIHSNQVNSSEFKSQALSHLSQAQSLGQLVACDRTSISSISQSSPSLQWPKPWRPWRPGSEAVFSPNMSQCYHTSLIHHTWFDPSLLDNYSKCHSRLPFLGAVYCETHFTTSRHCTLGLLLLLGSWRTAAANSTPRKHLRRKTGKKKGLRDSKRF